MRLIDEDALKDGIDFCVEKGMGSTIAFTFKHIVDSATTIEAVQGWRTGKPTKGGKYIVTLIGIGGYRFVSIMHYDKPFMPNIEVSGACWYREDEEWGDVVYDDKDILAWMPLPKPYKGGDTE